MGVLWTDIDAAAATGGQATAPFAATGLSLDTRSLQPGDLFIALKAARDGHDFVAQALDKGAAAALVDHVPEGVMGPCLVVKDVMAGLTALGAAGRARARARVVAVTGSVGKTSTKEMLREMLAGFGTVHAAEASFNNHWGVPITLARPHVAMITTIAAAHLEAFENLDGIAREKSAIYKGLEPSGIAIFPEGLAQSPQLKSAAPGLAVGFGQTGDVRQKSLRRTPGALVIEARVEETDYLLRLTDAGAHFGMNALGCLAVARALSLDLALAAQALGRWRPPSGRGRRERILLDPATEASLTLIDDAFNANPASLAAALDVLAETAPLPGGRRIAILGDMLELGPDEAALHRALATLASMERIHIVHTVGPRMAVLHGALPAHRRGRHVAGADDLGADAHSLVRPGDVVLVKGSKGSYVSRIVDALRHLGHPEPEKSDGSAGE